MGDEGGFWPSGNGGTDARIALGDPANSMKTT